MSKNVTTDLGANNLVNNNSTDNLAHLNAAMAAWVATDGEWYWPAGSGYVFSATPNAVPNGMVWRGEGPGLTIINGTRAAPSGGAVLSFVNSQNVAVTDMTITTPDTANACDQNALVGGSVNLLFRNVKLSNGNSAGVRASSRATSLRFFQGELTNIHQNASAAGFSGELADAFIGGTYFHNMATETSNTRHCIYINGSTNPTNVTIQGCNFTAWGGGEAVALKGDGTGSVTGAGYNLAVNGCSFDTTSASGACVSAQGVQGAQITNNLFYFGSSSSAGIAVSGDCWNFLIDGNNFMSPPIETESLAISLSGGNGGGRISNNVIAMANARYDVSRGIQVAGSVGNLEIDNNTISGLGCGILFTTAQTYAPNVQGVGDIYCHDNNINIPTGATNLTTGGRFVPGLSVGQSAAIVVDGKCSGLKLFDNKTAGLTYDLVFTTANGSTGSSGQADDIRYRFVNASPAVAFTNGAIPTNVSQGAQAFAPVNQSAPSAHAFTTSNT